MLQNEEGPWGLFYSEQNNLDLILTLVLQETVQPMRMEGQTQLKHLQRTMEVCLIHIKIC